MNRVKSKGKRGKLGINPSFLEGAIIYSYHFKFFRVFHFLFVCSYLFMYSIIDLCHCGLISNVFEIIGASLVAQMVKNLYTLQETEV